MVRRSPASRPSQNSRAATSRGHWRRASPGAKRRQRSSIATAVIAFRRLRLSGWIAWWIWGGAHVYFLVSLRNRLIVVTQWLWSYLLFERGARLITGSDDAARP